MYQFDRNRLKIQLEPLRKDDLTIFALLCSERLYGVFWAFSKREHREEELTIYNDTLNATWAWLVNQHISSESQMISRRARNLVHDSEQFGDPLGTQAQCAAIALTYAVRSFSATDLDVVSWCALQVVE